jgi:hypothetical protein
MNPIDIDCADPSTVNCTTVESIYKTDIEDALLQAYAAAALAGDNAEPYAQLVGIDCNRYKIYSLCIYAASKGWDFNECDSLGK